MNGVPSLIECWIIPQTDRLIEFSWTTVKQPDNIKRRQNGGVLDDARFGTAATHRRGVLRDMAALRTRAPVRARCPTLRRATLHRLPAVTSDHLLWSLRVQMDLRM